MIPPVRITADGKVRERFLIAGETGHSEYWRRDKSPVEIVELAKLLRGIRKIVSQVGKNSGTVVWEGMLDQSDSIDLDPSPIIGRYPIPAAQADIAVGLAVRGAFLKTEWTDHVRKLAQAKFERLPPVYAYKFSHYLSMTEKVYADLVANRSIFGLYAGKAREWETEKAAKHFTHPPLFTELLHIWWRIATDPKQEAFTIPYEDRSIVGMVGRTAAGQFYTKPMALLNSIVANLITECAALPSVTQRCEYRLNLYESIFDELLGMVKFWPTDRKDPFLLASESNDDMVEEDQEKDAIKAVFQSYTNEIESNLEKKHIDFTQQVKSVVANFDEVVRVEGTDIVMPAKKNIDNALLYKLMTVLQLVAQRNISYSRGLASGQIDRRRLYRAPTTGAIFNLKKSTSELFNDIILLVDCSGSMADPNKWAKNELIYQTLFTAILSYHPGARLLAYNERKDTCRITDIYQQGKFFSVMPHGRTASGEAIIATALTLGNRQKKPFIIHLTDGASNYGCGVSSALKLCRKQKINLLTIGLDCDPTNQTALRHEYGDLIQFINNVDQLPVLFKNLLSSSKVRH